jgi:antirestriction protein ArdC
MPIRDAQPAHAQPSERDARRAAERRLVTDAVAQLRRSAGWQAWLLARSRFHRYSLHNQLLIAHQRPGATRVASFRAWLGLGYCVRAGERAIRIWAPRPPSKAALARWQGHEDGAERPRTHFRLVAVFAQDQVEPLPPPAVPAPLEPPIASITGSEQAALLAPLCELAVQIGYTVRFVALAGGEGNCDPVAQTISIEASLAPNGQIAALIHELAHALRRSDAALGSLALSYAEEELVVECVAWSVCRVVGLDTSANSVPYLAAWSQGTDIAVLERAAELINRLAGRIEQAVGAV